jgi:hypothetical protein
MCSCHAGCDVFAGTLMIEPMKLRYTIALGLLMLASCTPSIEQSTTRAEAPSDRAERSATSAEQSADQSFKTSVRALIVADQAEKDARRANNVISRMEAGTVKHGDLLVQPTEGSARYWCLMGPPIIQGSPMGSETVGWDAPRSEFWVDEIFDSKSDCRDELRKFHRNFVRSELRSRRNIARRNIVHLVYRRFPFRSFCAACSNEGEDEDDED